MPHSSSATGGATVRKRKALLAGGVVLGLGAAATIAAWSDDVWVSATFNASSIQIESSLQPDSGYSQHGAIDALTLQGSTTPGDSASFSTPIALKPGETAYVPVYLRTAESTDSSATVTVSAAQMLDTVEGSGVTTNVPLWDFYVTYGARAVPISDIFDPPSCDEGRFTQLLGLGSTPLFGVDQLLPLPDERVPMTDAGTTNSFTLGANASSTYMVCFRFHLDSAVTTESPASNGTSIYPYWVFTGAES